jgi:PAS domain S-box-containing protein
LSSALLEEESIVIVPDARSDPRFAGSKLVQNARGVRFYAAVPLCAPEGAVLGVLSVWDYVPGDLTPSQVESLEALGRMAMAQLNLWRRQRQLEKLEAQHERVEMALREAETKFRSIFEHTVVGIYQTTPEGRYLSANPMLARIYGYATPDELMEAVANIEVQLYVDPKARERFVSALQTQDTITNFEAQIRRKDGTIIWITENARVVRDDRDRVFYYEGTVQDVTARKQAEEQLAASEMLYHSLVEELPQNIFRKDARERFIFANGRFCQTVERPLEEVLGKTDFDLYGPELARKYQEDDQRVMREGRTVRETERNVTPDGAVHWVEVIKSPLRDVNGAIVGIQGIFWDVTERKRLQDALAYERDLLQALLDHSPDIIYFKDTQSRFVKVGHALARRFHVADPEELVGKTVRDLVTSELADLIESEERRLMETGERTINRVEELVDHHGRRTWVSVTKVPTYNRAGAILGLVGVARDITPLIEAEQALREAEEKYRGIFENSVEGIFQTSPEGRFIRVNPALARIYGYASPEELMARLTDIRTQVYVDPGRREEFVRLVLEKGSITGFESEVFRKDGATTWVSESARIVRDREGRLAYFEGTLEDISGRKRVEAEQEKARQAALESARLKSEFVATVSHEIRTPLNAILPNTERLLETHLTSQQRYLAESVEHGARMLLQIVDDILDFSKIEARAIALEEIDFDVHDVIERTVMFFASGAETRHLELVGNIHSDVPHQLRGDPSRLGQILNNLVGNAIKFTAAGEIVVEVSTGELSEDTVELRVEVRDTGIGIPPSAHDRVFQAFAQADGSMSRRYGGTGLGLAITRGLVELMGGTIGFTSEVGKGTNFRFNVRLRRPANPQPEPEPNRVLAGRRVMVLEGNAAQREVIAATLRALGADFVVAAGSISDALEQVRRAQQAGHELHLVLFDADLPGSNLLQTARRLRIGGAAQTALVALTSPGAVGDFRGLEAAGISGALVKPLRQSRLPAELAAILSGKTGTSFMPASNSASDHPVARGLSVLLVEDQPFNQRVAEELLGRLGARVDAVFSGAEAIEACERHAYDLVLMDCQMPVMDGYEATRRIREAEQRRSAAGLAVRRVPIVALSANALTQDRDRGRQSGMDDYLTKPLSQSELIRVLEAVARAGGEMTAAPVEPETTGPPVLDPAPLEALGSPGNPEILADFISQFVADGPGRLARLHEALGTGNAAVLKAEAHSFKGSASYMGVRRLVEACAQVEAAAREGHLENGRELVEAVEREFAAAREALEAYVADSAPSR